MKHDAIPPLADDALVSFDQHDHTSACTCPMTDEIKETLCEQLAASAAVEECFGAFQRTQCDLLEVCCKADSTLTETINSRGGVSFRVGIQNRMDMTTLLGKTRAKEFARLVKPKVLWISPPCGPYSPLQNLNQNNPEQCKNLFQKRKRSRKLNRSCIELAEEQIERGDDFLWEWPWSNDGWKTSDVQQFLKRVRRKRTVYMVRLDGCMVGVKAPDNGFPMLKPWRLVTTNKQLAHALSGRCDGSHEHVECMGHNRAESSGYYPKGMCTIVARVLGQLEYGLTHEDADHKSCRLTCHGHEGYADGVDGCHDEDGYHGDDGCYRGKPTMNDGIYGVQDSDTKGDTQRDHEETPFSEAELKKVKESIRQLHVRSGHPTNRALMNCLRARGVDPRIITLTKEFTCDDCKEIQQLIPHHKVSLHGSNVLWHTMQMDIGQFVCGSETFHILFMVDEASHSTEGTLGTDLRANLNIRVKAEEQYRRTQAVSQIGRAMNSQPRRFEVFIPGDLVYYRRYQVPHAQKPSHAGLDKAKAGVERWYGPARVLATETATELDPPTRKPGGIVWVIAAGRLKRCSHIS